MLDWLLRKPTNKRTQKQIQLYQKKLSFVQFDKIFKKTQVTYPLFYFAEKIFKDSGNTKRLIQVSANIGKYFGYPYNDNVDSPEIRKWIGKIVGDEGEDLSRHDKWLCMMYPRLKLLQRFLSEDGIIFISISDVEHAHLRILCDEIFGSRNLVSNIIWQNNFSPRNDAKDIAYVTDNILTYSRNPCWHPKKLTRSDDMDARYDTPDNDPTPWTSSPAHAPSARTHKGMVYAIQHPYTGELFYPPSGRCWANEQAKMLKNMKMWADYKLEQIDDVEKRAQICGEIDIASMPDVKAILLDEPVESSREKVQTRMQMGLWPPFYFTNNGQGGMRVKKYLDSMGGKVVSNIWTY